MLGKLRQRRPAPGAARTVFAHDSLGRKEARTGRVAVVLAVSVIVAGGCGSSDDKSANPPPTADPTTTTAAETATALPGTWRTDPVTVADMVRTLRKAGLAHSVRGFKRNAPVTDAPTELVLEIGDDGAWDLYGQPEGEEREEIDYDARYEVEGDTVVATNHEGDLNTYRWSLGDDVLSLSWIKTTYPAYKGIPEEVFQRALYMTADFRRDP